MNAASSMPCRLIEFCEACAGGLAIRKDIDECIDFVGCLLPEFVCDKGLFREILEGMVRGDHYLDLQYATMFGDEVILYRDPEHLFSIRMFLRQPGEFDPIHDHNSWGVISPALGELDVVSYRRREQGERKDVADIEEAGRIILKPGDISCVRGPESIHKTGNPGEQMNIQISLYGSVLTRRNYINGFDEVSGRVYPIYAPKVWKQHLALRALSALG